MTATATTATFRPQAMFSIIRKKVVNGYSSSWRTLGGNVRGTASTNTRTVITAANTAGFDNYYDRNFNNNVRWKKTEKNNDIERSGGRRYGIRTSKVSSLTDAHVIRRTSSRGLHQTTVVCNSRKGRRHDAALTSFRKYVQSNLTELQQAPILIITSSAPETSSSPSNNNHIDSCQKKVNHVLAQQFGLRTVTGSGIASAVPLAFSKDTASSNKYDDIIRRTGARHVIGVGSGPAIDLAKSIVALHRGDGDDSPTSLLGLTLVPCTVGALVASSMRPTCSLLLDPDEDTLVPFPPTPSSFNTGTIIPMTETSGNEMATALYVSISFILDAYYQQSQQPDLPEMAQKATDLLLLLGPAASTQDQEQYFQQRQQEILDLLVQSTYLVSYGLGEQQEQDKRATNEYSQQNKKPPSILETKRSIPLALAASMIPRLFPTTPMMDFFAGVVPGMWHLLKSSGHVVSGDGMINNHESKELVGLVKSLEEIYGQSSASTGPTNSSTSTLFPPVLKLTDTSLDGFSIGDMAISHILDNQSAWPKQLNDHPDQVLLHVLEKSVPKRDKEY